MDVLSIEGTGSDPASTLLVKVQWKKRNKEDIT